MLEEDDPVLAAEYLITTSVARALAVVEPGHVRVERLIGRAFRNAIMRRLCSTVVPMAMSQGRIDVVVSEDDNHIKPFCLIEVKRDTSNLRLIEADADRLSILIEHTFGNLPDLFGFCIFPLMLTPDSTSPSDYTVSRRSALAKVDGIIQSLRTAHHALTIEVHHYQKLAVNRPSITSEVYDDETTEDVWDSGGFQIEPAAILIHK